MWHQMSIGKVTTLRGDSLAISLSLLSLPILSCDIYIKDFAAPFSGETYVVQIIILTLSFFFLQLCLDQINCGKKLARG